MKIVLSVVLLPFLAVPCVQEKKCEWPEMRALVGLEDAVYFRGESRLVNGTSVVALPLGFETFVKGKGRTVQVTCIDGYSPLFVSRVQNGTFTVNTTDQGAPAQAFFWEVKAVCASAPFPNGVVEK